MVLCRHRELFLQIMRMLSKQRIISITPLSGMETLLNLLKEMPNVSNIVENEDYIDISFDGEDKEVAGLLESIIKAGVSILGFKEKDGDLEEIFMEITGGENKDA